MKLWGQQKKKLRKLQKHGGEKMDGGERMVSL